MRSVKSVVGGSGRKKMHFLHVDNQLNFPVKGSLGMRIDLRHQHVFTNFDLNNDKSAHRFDQRNSSIDDVAPIIFFQKLAVLNVFGPDSEKDFLFLVCRCRCRHGIRNGQTQ